MAHPNNKSDTWAQHLRIGVLLGTTVDRNNAPLKLCGGNLLLNCTWHQDTRGIIASIASTVFRSRITTCTDRKQVGKENSRAAGVTGRKSQVSGKATLVNI